MNNKSLFLTKHSHYTKSFKESNTNVSILNLLFTYVKFYKNLKA